jgi:uncharacterized protein involved in type VI secretion and phage assembly
MIDHQTVRLDSRARRRKKGRASSSIRMAQPHARPGYGFHFPLREAVEVMLTCIDGDPDRPIPCVGLPADALMKWGAQFLAASTPIARSRRSHEA